MYFLIKTKENLYVFNLRNFSRVSAYGYVSIKMNSNVVMNWECDSWKKDITTRYFTNQDTYGRDLYDGLQIILVRAEQHKYWLFQGEIVKYNPWGI